MLRRSFLSAGVATAGAFALGADFWRGAYAAPLTPARPGEGVYGPLQPADANGLQLPSGFRSRVLATSGDAVPGARSGYVWHGAPDGGATFPVSEDPADGWVYVSNAELGSRTGGVGALRFDQDGEVVDAYRILDGTTRNCAGGPTTWGTWLSCEETQDGRVWECDPLRPGQGVVKPALGSFNHEAVAEDPVNGRLYLTEDMPDGALYRFTPDAGLPDLTSGTLEVAVGPNPLTYYGPAEIQGGATAQVRWVPVPDPTGSPIPTRHQIATAMRFNGGEGIWYDSGVVFFGTKGDNRVYALDVDTDELDIVYDQAYARSQYGEAPLTGVDNLVVAAGSGDIYVAEDGGTMDIVLITPDRTVSRFVHITGQETSEITGPCFSPDGTRLYFSSQRGGPHGDGITYEVTGPFRRTRPEDAAGNTVTSLRAANVGRAAVSRPERGLG